jgi:hypothetical protein
MASETQKNSLHSHLFELQLVFVGFALLDGLPLILQFHLVLLRQLTAQVVDGDLLLPLVLLLQGRP